MPEKGSEYMEGTALWSIVKSYWVTQNAFERLEPSAAKVARWVLRRGGGSNAVPLSGKSNVSGDYRNNICSAERPKDRA